MFHFHRWSDWAVTERGKVVHHIYHSHKLGSYITQERFCPECGMTQIKTQRTTLLSNVILIPEITKVVAKHDKVK